MRGKSQNENYIYKQRKQQTTCFINDIHKLEEEDEDEGTYPPIQYDENYQQNSDSSDDEIQKFDDGNNSHRKQDKQLLKKQNSIKISIYAKEQEQKQQIKPAIKPRIENMQDIFKIQLEKKQKLKENLTSLSKIKSRLGSGDEESGNLKVNLQESQVNLLQPPTIKELKIKSLNGSQVNINDLISQGNSQNGSMVEVMNMQLGEISEARKKHLEQIKLKQLEQNIKNDKNLSDEQKKVKLDNFKHSMIVDRIKNIIEKTKKIKEQQYKPAKKEQRFEMQISIFKKLDTYLETKEYLQKINQSNENQNKQQKSIQNKVQLDNSTEIIRKKKNTKIFKSLYNNQSQEQGELKQENIQKILQRSYQYLNDKNDLILQQEQILGGSFLHQLEKMVFGDRIKEEGQEDMLQLKKQLKQKFEQVTTQENQSDTNVFYDILQYQLETGYFCKVDPDFNKKEESSSYEQQNNHINEIINEKVIVDKKRAIQTKRDELEEYRKKAKKITQLLLSTSKNILKKNIEENNLAIQQARRARANLKIQQYLNRKQLEKNIKNIPQKLQKAYNQELETQAEDKNNSKEQQEKVDQQEEEEERKKMLQIMLPSLNSNQSHNLDKQLQSLESSLTKFNSSSISQNIQKIRNSVDRRFSLSNEQRGIIIPTQKQSIFGKVSQPSPLLTKKTQDDYQFFGQNEQISEMNILLSPLTNKKELSSASRRSKTNLFKLDSQTNMKSQKIINRSNSNQSDCLNQYQLKAKTVQDQDKCKGSKRILFKKQSSISKCCDKSPSSQMIQTEASTQGSPALHAMSYIGSVKSGFTNRKYNEPSVAELNSFDSKIEKLNKKHGFSVMNIKQVINQYKLNDQNGFSTNKFQKLDKDKQNFDYIQENRSKMQSLSMTNQRSKRNYSTDIPYKKNNQANFFRQPQGQQDSQVNPYYPHIQQRQQIFQPIKSQNFEKQKTSQSNIFLTENIDTQEAQRKIVSSEKGLISNHFSALQQRRSIANLGDKLHQIQKFNENNNNNSSQKLLKKTSFGQISDSNKNLEQLMNNINHFKISYKNDKGFFSKQINELQQKMQQQQERLTNQPLESLRLCLEGVNSLSIKPYFFDRKQIKKIT